MPPIVFPELLIPGFTTIDELTQLLKTPPSLPAKLLKLLKLATSSVVPEIVPLFNWLFSITQELLMVKPSSLSVHEFILPS